MGYITGSILNDATPVDELISALEAEMTSVGWTLLEEHVISTQPFRAWQSPATSFGTTWCLVIHRANDTTVTFRVGEGYEVATHEIKGFCPSSNNAFTVKPNGNVNFPLNTGTYSQTLVNSGYLFNVQIDGLNTVECNYWFLVTPENVILQATSSSVFDYLYAGFCDPIIEGVANNLILVNHTPGSSTSSIAGSMSRIIEKANTTQTSTWWNVQTYVYGTGVNHGHASPGTPRPLFDAVPVGKFLLRANNGVVDEQVRGWLRHIRQIGLDAALAPGDTLSDGTDEYVCLYPNTGVWMKTTNLATP